MYRLVSTICAFVVALVITSAELFYFGNFCVIRHPVLSVLVHSDPRMNCGQGHFTADWLWLYQSSIDRLNPNAAPIGYEGCNTAFLKTNRFKKHRRPNGTIYEKLTGAGKSIKQNGSFCNTVYYGSERAVNTYVSSTSVDCKSLGWDKGTTSRSTHQLRYWHHYNLIHKVTKKTISAGLERVVRSGALVTDNSSHGCSNEGDRGN